MHSFFPLRAFIYQTMRSGREKRRPQCNPPCFYRCAGRSQQSVLGVDWFLTLHTKTVGIRKIVTLLGWRPETWYAMIVWRKRMKTTKYEVCGCWCLLWKHACIQYTHPNVKTDITLCQWCKPGNFCSAWFRTTGSTSTSQKTNNDKAVRPTTIKL